MSADAPEPGDGGEDILLSFVNLLLRARRLIATCVVGGALLGLAATLARSRQYESRAMFKPQSIAQNFSAMAEVASGLGFRVPPGFGGGWTPALYADLLRSRGVLEPIARDTFEVLEEGGRRETLLGLLAIHEDDDGERAERGVRRLRRIARVREVRSLGAVEVLVQTRWPSVSRAIAGRLVSTVHDFNRATSRLQASKEREFVEARVAEAEVDVRRAEDSLQAFLQRNRSMASSPALTFQRERLEQEAQHRRTVLVRLTEAMEEARIGEIRDTPVITVLEDPTLPASPTPRRVGLGVSLGMLGGGLLGIVGAIAGHVARDRRSRSR